MTNLVYCLWCKTPYDADSRHSIYRHRKANKECGLKVRSRGRPAYETEEERMVARKVTHTKYNASRKTEKKQNVAPKVIRKKPKKSAKEKTKSKKSSVPDTSVIKKKLKVMKDGGKTDEDAVDETCNY